MNTVESLYNTTFGFEPIEFPFHQMFFDVATNTLSRSGQSTESLASLHHACTPESLSNVYAAWYVFMEEDEFMSTYRRFIRKHVAPLFDDPIYYQKKPGIRAHLHETLTVQYHTDEWYGHD